MDAYLGDGVGFAVLDDRGRPRTVSNQFRHNRSARKSGHWAAGGEETRRGASAERRIPAGSTRSRIWSNTAAGSFLTRVTGRWFVVILLERLMRECAILVALSVTLVMASLGDNGQGCNTHNGKLAQHRVQCAQEYWV